MKKPALILSLLFIAGIFCFPLSAMGAGKSEKLAADSLKVLTNTAERESIFPEGSRLLGLSSHFSWGADIGASIDLGGNNFSTFDADVNFGYKDAFISFIGVGGGVHQAFGTGNQFFPVYMLFRTSFRKKPSHYFLNIKAGYSFNSLKETESKGGINLSIGLGIKLAETKNFRSHLILSYGYYRLSGSDENFGPWRLTHIDQAQLRFGVSF